MRVLLSLLMISLLCASDQIPAPPQEVPILIQGATLHTVSQGAMIADILFEHGRITGIGKDIVHPADLRIVDGEGKHVYPGLIAAACQIGLTEIGAVRATNDYAETGDLNPNIVANVAYHPDSEIIPVTRSNGVLLANVVPRGGILSGQSALMMLDGWTWEDATLSAPTSLHLYWPSMNVKSTDQKSEGKLRETRQQAIQRVEDLFEEARAYAAGGAQQEPPVHDLRLESMIPYVRGELPVTIHAMEVRQIEAAVAWGKRLGLRIQISGGADAWMLTDLLRENQVPVIVPGTLRLPERRFDDYDQAYRLPAQLQAAGVDFCISAPGASNVRNLPYHAAMAVAYGLDPGSALESITLAPARILGVADRVGSLEVGKDATLFIANGDILDIRTQVEQVFIQGKWVDMSDRQKTLYAKYRTKYEQLGLLKKK